MSKERLENKTSGIFIFVGENRSKTAKENDDSWAKCQATGKWVASAIQLFGALKEIGVDPKEQFIVNLFNDAHEVDAPIVEILKEWVSDGEIIIGMGDVVQKKLNELGIPHREMIHPAALGKIRKKELYLAHVKSVLSSPFETEKPEE